VFFYRYRARDGARRQIKLGDFGPLSLAEARKDAARIDAAKRILLLLAHPHLNPLRARAVAAGLL
jgi:hypothetical protein